MSSKTFRVLSYNIHKGFNARNTLFVLRDIREAIRTVNPDFVFLQEVIGEHHGHRKRVQQWPKESQFEYMADTIWPHFAYGRNAVYDEGHHGNAILSKYPILEWENEDISTSAIESRGILHGVVKPNEHLPPLHLLCTHFGLFEADRRVQAIRLCDRIKRKVSLGQKVIVAGDFNDWTLRLSPVLKREAELEEAFFSKHKRHARTFPARLPILRLDRIYLHGLSVKSIEVLADEPWSKLSDHVALLAELDWL